MSDRAALPDGWAYTEIGQVLTLQRGFDITKATQRPGSIPVISSGGIGSHHDTAAAAGPGVVIGRKGTLGKVFYSAGDYWPHDTTLWVKDFKGSDPRFVYYFFQTLGLERHDVGSSNPTLNRNHVHPLTVPWPGERDQRAIAEVLGALDDKLAVNDRIAATAEKLLQARFTGCGLAAAPAPGAPSVRTDELIEINPKVPRPTREDAVYVGMSALPTTTALVREWTRRKPAGGARFCNGDTVFARITPCLENGKTAFIDFLQDGEAAIGSTEFLVLRARPGVPRHFPYLLARSPRFRAHAKAGMIGSSGRQRCPADRLAGFVLPRPAPQDLELLGAHSETTFALLESQHRESARLTALRDTLLPRLVTGKLPVKDAVRAVEDAV